MSLEWRRRRRWNGFSLLGLILRNSGVLIFG